MTGKKKKNLYQFSTDGAFLKYFYFCRQTGQTQTLSSHSWKYYLSVSHQELDYVWFILRYIHRCEVQKYGSLSESQKSHLFFWELYWFLFLVMITATKLILQYMRWYHLYMCMFLLPYSFSFCQTMQIQKMANSVVKDLRRKIRLKRSPYLS